MLALIRHKGETDNVLSVVYFPISILWKVKITLTRKIILSGMFSLVLLTMAVTIVRGGNIVIRAFGRNSNSETNLVFYWFWLYIEVAMGECNSTAYSGSLVTMLKCYFQFLAFLISCVVSFRALFSQREKDKQALRVNMQKDDHGRQPSSLYLRMHGRLRNVHDSLLETCRSSERDKDVHQDEAKEENGDSLVLVT